MLGSEASAAGVAGRLPSPDEIVAMADELERRARAAASPCPRWLLAASREEVRLVPLRGRVLVGRGRECAVVLENRNVSRQHAALRIRHGELVIEDLGSRNGTFAGGAAVTERAVAQGEEIWFADEPVRFWVR